MQEGVKDVSTSCSTTGGTSGGISGAAGGAGTISTESDSDAGTRTYSSIINLMVAMVIEMVSVV